MNRTMPSAVIEAARSAAATIPGLEIRSVSWLRIPTSSGAMTSECGIVLDAWGWGPTLHIRRRRWEIRTQSARPGAWMEPISEGEAIHMATNLRGYLLVQEELAAWAVAEDMDAPMPQPDAASFEDICHLSIDRRLAALMIANRGARGAVSRILNTLTRIICSGDGSETSIEADELDDELQGCASIMGGRGVLWFDEPLGSKGTFDGIGVEIETDLPDTVLAAATGRRLGDLMATGVQVLDDSIIAVVTDGGATDVRLELEPDLARIEDLPALREHIPGGGR